MAKCRNWYTLVVHMASRKRAVVSEKEMTMTTHLVRRDGTYYARIRIPKDLHRHFGVKREIKRSLKTKSLAEARPRLRVEAADIQRMFDDLRINPIDHNLLVERDLKALSENELMQIVRLVGRHYLEGDEITQRELTASVARKELAPEALDDYRVERIEYRDFLRQIFIAKNWKEHAQAAESALKFLKISCDRTEPKFEVFNRHLLEQSLVSADAIVDRLSGKVVTTESVVKQNDVYRPVYSEKIGTLSDVAKEQLAAQQRVGDVNQKTADEKTAIAAQFDRYTRGKLIRNVTNEDAQGYVDFLVEDEGLMPSTVSKKVGFLRAMFQFAKGKKYIRENPASSLNIPKRVKKKTRVAYEMDDLTTIFSAPIFTQGKRPRGGRGEAAVWLPVLSLYSGARLEELALLETRDFYWDAHDKTWAMKVVTLKEGQVKPENRTKRAVPIHPNLVEIGLLRFVESQKAEKHERFFHQLTRDKYGSLSATYSKWWGRYTRRLGIVDKRKVFHSLRHLFKHIMRLSSVDDKISRAIMGHSLSDVADGYGAEDYPLKPKLLAIKKLRFPGIVIPKLA